MGRRKGSPGRGHDTREVPEGRNSFGQALQSLCPVWDQGCGHREGTEQGKPAAARPCSGRRGPTPGVWGYGVPKELSWTSTAQEREVAPGTARSPPVPGCTLSLANYLLVDNVLYLERLLPALATSGSRARRSAPKTFPGTEARRIDRDQQASRKDWETEHPSRKQYNNSGTV